MTAVLTPLLAVLGPFAVLLLVAVLFAETGLLVGFFLPGDSLLFAAGARADTRVPLLEAPTAEADRTCGQLASAGPGS